LSEVKWIFDRDVKSLSWQAATLVGAVLRKERRPVIGFATGASPLSLYRALVELSRENLEIWDGWRHAETFNLDEYVGLAPEHPQSYHAYMRNNLFQFVPIDGKRIHIPDGTGAHEEECKRYDATLERCGWPHIQILGIGRNGHIGFNEPAEWLPLRTHVVQLTDTTRQANARFFSSPEEVPTHAVTMGIGDILRAKHIVLLAFGETKREALQRAFCGEVSTHCPASFLQLHPNVTVFTDQHIEGFTY
jgi:glucosamine-6-phosphate deaminase